MSDKKLSDFTDEKNMSFNEAMKSLKEINKQIIIEPFSERNERLMKANIKNLKREINENANDLANSVNSLESLIRIELINTMENSVENLNDDVEEFLNDIRKLKESEISTINDFKKIDAQILKYIEMDRIKYFEKLKSVELSGNKIDENQIKTLVNIAELENGLLVKYNMLLEKQDEMIEYLSKDFKILIENQTEQEKKFVDRQILVLKKEMNNSLEITSKSIENLSKDFKILIENQIEQEKKFVDSQLLVLKKEINNSLEITNKSIENLLDKQNIIEKKSKFNYFAGTIMVIIQVAILIMLLL